MRLSITILAATAAFLATTAAAAQPAEVAVGFAAKTITPVGPPPPGWGFTPHPVTGVWGEEFVDLDGDDCYTIAGISGGDFDPETGEITPPTVDAPELHIDDIRNTELDPQSAGKWDGIWTNAGFGGQCAKGALDDIWARAVVVSSGDVTAAMVSVDVVGYFQEEIKLIKDSLARNHGDLDIDALIIAATHAHEGPDTMGLWHGVTGLDGKYPMYMEYIRARIIEAIVEAYGDQENANVRFAQGTEPRGIRDSRPPVVPDNDVWTAQFVRPADGSTIGTIVNWSNHPEAMWSDNDMITSDYPHATRAKMENVLGGTSVFFSGSVGGLMTPGRVFNIPGYETPPDCECYGRTLALGEIVADAAIAALSGAPLATDGTITIAHKDFVMPFENQSLTALNQAGVFDKDLSFDGGNGNAGVETEMYAVTLGPAVFITVPGELFPEIANGDYGRDHDPVLPGDCPGADTGRPFEPVIRDQFSATYEFLFGLGQDELGYIVPRYDFWAWGFPPTNEIFEEVPEELRPPPLLPEQDPRPPIVFGVIQRDDPCGEGHYEETVSAASSMAPIVACTAAELAGHDPFAGPFTPGSEYEACSPENTESIPGGIIIEPPAEP